MNAERITSLAHSESASACGIYKFSHLGNAIGFSLGGKKSQMVVMGDDERFWVMRPAWAQKMERAGFEIA